MTLTGVCGKCNNRIEFDAEADGTESQCPLCSEAIILTSEVRKKKDALAAEERRKQQQQEARSFADHEQKKFAEEEKRRQQAAKSIHTPVLSQVVGGLVILLGVVWFIVSLGSGISNEGTVNLGKMHDREVNIIASCAVMVMGGILVVAGNLAAICHNQKCIYLAERK